MLRYCLEKALLRNSVLKNTMPLQIGLNALSLILGAFQILICVWSSRVTWASSASWSSFIIFCSWAWRAARRSLGSGARLGAGAGSTAPGRRPPFISFFTLLSPASPLASTWGLNTIIATNRQSCGSGMIYSGSGSSLKFWEFRVRILPMFFRHIWREKKLNSIKKYR